MSDEYPESDFPWSFYFNGEVMPKWGACWGMAQVVNFLQLERAADQDLGHRDVYIINCQIDHVGVVESADPDVFIYAVQEVLHILLSQRDSVLASLSDQSPDVYSGLVAATFRMRELALQQRCAFWSSGYVKHDNTRRLHSALGYLAPADRLAGRDKEIFAARDRKLEAARQQRQAKRQAARARPAPVEEKPQNTVLTIQPATVKVAPSRETEAGSAEEQPAAG